MRARNDLLRSSSIRPTTLVYPPRRIPQYPPYLPTPRRRCRLPIIPAPRSSYRPSLRILSMRTRGITRSLNPASHETWRHPPRRPFQRTCRGTTPGGPWSTTRQASAPANVPWPPRKRLRCTALELGLPTGSCMGASRCRRAISHLTSGTSRPSSCRRCATRCYISRQRSRTYISTWGIAGEDDGWARQDRGCLAIVRWDI